jgi:hypothetical protein
MTLAPYIPGYGLLGKLLREGKKANLYQYHAWTVWIPKVLLYVEGSNTYAPTYAIASSKEYQRRVPQNDR